MKTKILPVCLLLAVVALCIAGTKISQLRRTTTVASNDLFMVVRTTDGRKTNLNIEARHLGPGLGPWITNSGSGGGVAGLESYSTNINLLPSIFTNVVYVNATGATAVINGSLYTNALKNAPARSLLKMSKGEYDIPTNSMPLIRNLIDQDWESGSTLVIGRTNGPFAPIFSDENEIVVCNITGSLRLYASNETSIGFYLDRTGTKIIADAEVVHIEGLVSDSSAVFLLGSGAPELVLNVRDYARNNTYDLAYFSPATGAKARVKISKAYFQGDAIELNDDAPEWGNVDIDIGYAEQNPGSPHQSYLQMAGRCAVRVGYLKVGGLTATMVFNGITNGLLHDSIIESQESAQWSLIQPQIPSGKATAGWLRNVTLIGGTNVDVLTITNSAARPLVLENVTVRPGWGSTNWARGFTPSFISAENLTVASAKPIGAQTTLLGTNWFSYIHNRGGFTNAGSMRVGGVATFDNSASFLGGASGTDATFDNFSVNALLATLDVEINGNLKLWPQAASSVMMLNGANDFTNAALGAGLSLTGTTLDTTAAVTPVLLTGTGGALTNYTLLAGQVETLINGFTNVSIRAVMQTDPALVKYWTCTITNGSGTDRTFEFSAVTNRVRWSGTYGTNAPNRLTNAMQLMLAGRSHGTNTVIGYTYFAWP